ncbi:MULTISPECIES: dephospho-CoA kinase [Marinobacter]|jgi:dephospho-CoA kinase|uniref:Dephospho-CoA kinase n=1 Tax=Marinobacter salarius TaxID=1420917 RepID=A0ABY1FIA2_9GAMM|nr:MULTISPECIES: dephospho-CoA kinase [Marinobacter]KXJ43800.1 MAG: dephospho-CoA kinase [Marinobacter sp. Hex_13]OLF82168.1 dephospho-CoA kinase [Marinobacter sp. C18]SFL40773.1 dephospho-CoA kinase [Marinobacter salarius]|tara:strand:- start:6757 stop:7359 length:603 start_codon:yes stop_codon:yes gene_type:complete
MAVVGLTGGIGSGKSTVARLFGALGVHWVDADDVAREVVEPGTPALEKIAEHFGQEILLPDGSLDRAALRRIVFDAPEERAWLEELLHPVIREELMRQLRPDNYSLPYVLLVSPLLLETDQHELVDKIVVVDVPVDVQIKRTMARDTDDRAQVERIIAAQMAREKRLQKADDVVDNNLAMMDVERQVEQLHQTFLAAFGR